MNEKTTVAKDVESRNNAACCKLAKMAKNMGGDKLSTCLLLLSIFAMIGTAEARNLVWTGTVGDSFENPAKWNIQNTSTHSTTKPGPGDIIVIGINKPITLDLSDDTNLAWRSKRMRWNMPGGVDEQVLRHCA